MNILPSQKNKKYIKKNRPKMTHIRPQMTETNVYALKSQLFFFFWVTG